MYISGPKNIGTDVIATINNEPIKLQDFQERLSAIKMNYPPDQKLDLKKIKASILRRMIIDSLILQEADNKKIEITDEELDRYVKNIKQNYTEADFNQMLNNQFKTYEDWIVDVKKKLLIEKTLSKSITEKINVSDKEIQDYYDKNYGDKTTEAKVKLAQIFNTDKATMEQALSELKSGAPFEEVAKKYSQSPEAVNGGVVGYIKKGEGIPIFDKAFDIVGQNQTSIVQSEYGFHILRVIEYVPAGKITLDSVKQRIITELASEKETKVYEEWLSDSLKSARIFKNSALMESIK
jgi:parvulin-like peptidyl-prolyl isomerase